MVNKNKNQGNSRENASRSLLEENDWVVVRTKNTKSVPDLLCFDNGGESYVFAVEVKSTIQKKWYPSKREFEQYFAIKAWSRKNCIDVYYHLWMKVKSKWVRFNLTLWSVGELYFKDDGVET